jgi:pimeloyl-ACP methyl ester carboxylesterase
MPAREIKLRDDLTIPVEEAGEGRPALILHGGGGPMTMTSLAGHLAESFHVLTPTHPGWDGTSLPASIATVPDLAAAYLDLLAGEGLEDVVLVGSSLGGWLVAEIAARAGRDGRVGAVVLIDPVGIEVPEEPLTDFFALDPAGVAAAAFHDPEPFFVDPATLPPEVQAAQAANVASLQALAGDPYMHDLSLRGRLGEVTAPTLVIWGDSDGIASPDYGRAYAASIPGARFELVADAGHLPQLEQPAATFDLIDAFLG